jgi:peptidoglycan/LPS O-acetylase OafA/YrhL
MVNQTTEYPRVHASSSTPPMGANLSIYLDLLRFSAAFLVFIFHASYPRLSHGALPNFGATADDAVMAFFVLSGFVIAHTADTKERVPAVFIKARFARLYSVALPALLLTFTVDCVGRSIAPVLYDGWWYQGSWPLARALANALFLSQLWFLDIRPFSDGPFWSIGYEFWYYMLFAAAFFLRGRARVSALIAISIVIGPKILVLLPVWLLGVLIFRMRKWNVRPLVATTLFLLPIAFYVAFLCFDGRPHIDWRIDDFTRSIVDLQWSAHFASKYFVGCLVACNILGFAKVERLFDFGPARRLIHWCAGMTFALYLFHYPLLHFYAAILPDSLSASSRAALIISLTLATVILLAEITERRKRDARAVVDRLWVALATTASAMAKRTQSS